MYEMTCILVGVFLPFFSFFCTIVDMEFFRGRRGRYCMIVGFTTTYVISVYHH